MKQIPILAPTAGKARIDVLDVMRGIAILGIFFFNIPYMGQTSFADFGALKLLGWGPLDRGCWWFLNVLFDGTQRGLLQVLFGAGALILLRSTLEPGGAVEAADLYIRRNLWLIVFGLFDIFGLLWFGDVLAIYGLGALCIFPFRKLRSRTLLALGFLYLAVICSLGAVKYHAQVVEQKRAAVAMTKQVNHEKLSAEESAALRSHEKRLAALQVPPAVLAKERAEKFTGLPAYAASMRRIWSEDFVQTGFVLRWTIEDFFMLLIAMAMYKLGVTQGKRSLRFYVILGLVCYGLGIPERVISASQLTAYQALPTIGTVFGAPARLLVTIGHVALINALMKTVHGQTLLSPFKAAGRMAFSLYLIQDFLGDLVLFPGIGFGLWGRFGWFGLTMIALAVVVAQLVFANIWLRFFAMGPLEWLWRSLSYQHFQPLRHKELSPDPVVV